MWQVHYVYEFVIYCQIRLCLIKEEILKRTCVLFHLRDILKFGFLLPSTASDLISVIFVHATQPVWTDLWIGYMYEHDAESFLCVFVSQYSKLTRHKFLDLSFYLFFK